MLKDLLVISSYPSTEKAKNILKECILSLNKDFDIALCTHMPISEEIQNLVKYYIYDHRNEMIFSEDVFMYADSDSFYFQGYIEGSSTHPGFAVYRSILNGAKIGNQCYDWFYYLEGDAIMFGLDIDKMKSLKNEAISNNKKGWFFKKEAVLNSNIFCCNLEFFNNNFTECRNAEEYNTICNQIGSYGILENFLYSNVNSRNNLDKLLLLENLDFAEYFSESKMSLISYREDGIIYPFELRLVRVEGTDKIALVYINNNTKPTDELIDFKVNSTINKKLSLARTYLAEIIDIEDDILNIKIGTYEKIYSREQIFKSKSFVRFK